MKKIYNIFEEIKWLNKLMIDLNNELKIKKEPHIRFNRSDFAAARNKKSLLLLYLRKYGYRYFHIQIINIIDDQIFDMTSLKALPTLVDVKGSNEEDGYHILKQKTKSGKKKIVNKGGIKN